MKVECCKCKHFIPNKFSSICKECLIGCCFESKYEDDKEQHVVRLRPRKNRT